MHSESLVDKKKKNPGNIDSTKISSIEKKNVKVSKRKSSFFSKLDYPLLYYKEILRKIKEKLKMVKNELVSAIAERIGCFSQDGYGSRKSSKRQD